MDKIESYIQKQAKWQKGLMLIRSVLNNTELEETVKWGVPTYTVNGKNVAAFAGFKNHFGLWFFQGVFLTDKHQLLRNAQEGKTKGLRQMNFKSFDELDEKIIREYVLEAIKNQKEGKEIKPDRKKEIEIPKELDIALKANVDLEEAFNKLTPGKRKEYANYIVEAKREATKTNRLEKIIPMIKEGIGLYDKYKDC